MRTAEEETQIIIDDLKAAIEKMKKMDFSSPEFVAMFNAARQRELDKINKWVFDFEDEMNRVLDRGCHEQH